MGTLRKRLTVGLDPALYQALQLKAEATGRSIAALVSEAAELLLGEDVADLAAFEQRAAEPCVPFDEVVEDLRRRGRI